MKLSVAPLERDRGSLTVRQGLPPTFQSSRSCQVLGLETGKEKILRQCRRMLRLLVGDECDAIVVQVSIGHPETVYCHSESFDRLRTGSANRGTVILSRAKDLEILRRPAPAGLLRMTYKYKATRWMLLNKATQLWSSYSLSGLCPLRSYLLEKLRPLVGELDLHEDSDPCC